MIRFLNDAAREGGELLLYSDEPMDWMTGDRAYFALWASLMTKCVNNGVKIKIIHNVDRVDSEIIDAIRGWFPLYISGMIEPFVFQKDRTARFCHTVFLHTGSSCIHGFFPSGESDSRWYAYITDEKRLDLLEREYGAMLSASSPFLKVYHAADSAAYRAYCMEKRGARTFLLSGLPVYTMPEKLLTQIIDRAQISDPLKQSVLGLYRGLRSWFQELLRQETVHLILCPVRDAVQQQERLNFALDLVDLSIDCTEDEYVAHISAVMDLVRSEKNFHLTLLPESPFRDIQIAMSGDAVSVLRLNEPHAAFVFYNPTLTGSVSDYLFMLIRTYAADRLATLETLERLRHPSFLFF